MGALTTQHTTRRLTACHRIPELDAVLDADDDLGLLSPRRGLFAGGSFVSSSSSLLSLLSSSRKASL